MSEKSKKYFIVVLISVYVAYVFHSLSCGAINYAWPDLRTDLHIPDYGLGYISASVAAVDPTPKLRAKAATVMFLRVNPHLEIISIPDISI